MKVFLVRTDFPTLSWDGVPVPILSGLRGLKWVVDRDERERRLRSADHWAILFWIALERWACLAAWTSSAAGWLASESASSFQDTSA